MKRRARRIALLTVAVLGTGTVLLAILSYLRSSEIEVQVLPDRQTWQVGDAVRGTVAIRNIGWRPLVFTDSDLPRINILDAQGRRPPAQKPAQQRGPSIFICGGFLISKPIRVRPWQTYRFPFQLDTDPHAGVRAVCVHPGEYTLIPYKFGDHLQPARIVSAAIVFVDAGEEQVKLGTPSRQR